MRKMLTAEDINHNAECFKKQMARFIDFSDGKALMVNNADWLLGLNYIELLREVGACFSVNNMLRAECYKQRMEKGLTFLEFNYMIMQSYDFYHLYKELRLQPCSSAATTSGPTCWAARELIRRKLGKDDAERHDHHPAAQLARARRWVRPSPAPCGWTRRRPAPSSSTSTGGTWRTRTS